MILIDDHLRLRQGRCYYLAFHDPTAESTGRANRSPAQTAPRWQVESDQMPDDVFVTLKKRAAAYRALTDAYDDALLLAHEAGHGTPAAMEHLRRAIAMAPDVMDALRSYQAGVAALAEHLRAPGGISGRRRARHTAPPAACVSHGL